MTEAEYEMAMTYYDRSPAYQLDQTDTKRAIEQFQLFIDRYPTDSRVAEATERINELREKLARKRHASAMLYERRGLFEAAALEFDLLLEQRRQDHRGGAGVLEAAYAVEVARQG